LLLFLIVWSYVLALTVRISLKCTL
jgi:hypothetical protein